MNFGEYVNNGNTNIRLLRVARLPLVSPIQLFVDKYAVPTERGRC